MFLGGRERIELPGAIVAGRHPDVEYLRLIREHKRFQLISFTDVAASPSRAVNVVARRCGMYWAMAVWAHQHRAQWARILTTGEDVGLPLAIVQRVMGSRTPIAILTHGSYLGSRKAAYALRLVRDLPGLRFLCLSETLRGQFIKRFGVPAHQVVNVGYGVDTDFFDSRILADTAPPATRQIATAGMANRDYKTLVSAVAHKDVSLKIAADSAWFKTKLDIEGHSLPPNVEARSYGDYVGLRRLYAESALVVVPLYEADHACGYAVIAEAMAMGKPVITTHIRAHTDFVIDGETGFHVPPGDSKTLGDRITYLLSHPDVACEMGRRARQMIEKHYSLAVYNARIIAAFTSA